MTKKINLCVFISGRGSNLKAILEACKQPDFPARVSCIISNKADAGGLDYAKEFDVPYAIISHKDYATKQEFEKALLETLTHEPVDLICLAGFMRILSPYFLEQWGENIINIHPSLLPKYKGLDTHARAIEAGDKKTGCTVHYVTSEMDTGQTIIQRSIKILKKDTSETLAQKLLVEEHLAYSEAIFCVVEGKFKQVDQSEFNFLNTSTKELGSTQTPYKNAFKASRDMWMSFTIIMKYATLSVIAILSVMALFLL